MAIGKTPQRIGAGRCLRTQVKHHEVVAGSVHLGEAQAPAHDDDASLAGDESLAGEALFGNTSLPLWPQAASRRTAAISTMRKVVFIGAV
jgi:hypothetical protein